MKKSLLGCLVSLTMTACGEGMSTPEATADQTARSHAALVGDIHSIRGDTVCPPNEYLMPVADARTHQEALCAQLGTWDIVRLAGGGSMVGSGHGCTVQDLDFRAMGASVCMPRPMPAYFKSQGDNLCPTNAALMSPETAVARRTELCAYLGKWDIVRLTGGGSMVGYGAGCVIRQQDTQPMGWSLCEPTGFPFTVVDGDGPCAPGTAELSPQEARARQSEICATLGRWDIQRLSGRGTMKGPGAGCVIKDWEPGLIGATLCKTL
ncbi:hypothetical protein [Pyxidicoccus xibeiensis]|uniref:hypothetical protein n=1 Tax=Pyxidicoccus xibeiensis TaxID=2906759 RepID=UPI0020A73E19|nr:hypothetical protein [Pyxidicoccus xibeiensis]MCP3142786.1 hypothetical protein [Pyxidicoccus xibeiensis]